VDSCLKWVFSINTNFLPSQLHKETIFGIENRGFKQSILHVIHVKKRLFSKTPLTHIPSLLLAFVPFSLTILCWETTWFLALFWFSSFSNCNHKLASCLPLQPSSFIYLMAKQSDCVPASAIRRTAEKCNMSD
jgi:hypothetical protein